LIRKALICAAALLAPTLATSGAFAQSRPDQVAFRGLYKELVEINTTLSTGSCTAANAAMAARLKAAGFPDADVTAVIDPAHPKEGSLVAVLPGTDPAAKAILLLAHVDVVEANRADWERDPFALVEENGFFYARGASDDKAQAAIWVDTLIRLKAEGFKARRGVKVALTCGEETAAAFNGANDLATRHKALIDAEFALNEGGGGLLTDDGKPVSLSVQAGEKVYQDFKFEAVNPGGHSSRPVKDNAIYQLAGALSRVGAYDFPLTLTPTTRAYFEKMASLVSPVDGAAMKALTANPADKAAEAQVSKNPSWNSMLRTTCVATLVNAGHAPNALPQRATANINCRILPGVSAESVRGQLEKLAADPKVKVTAEGERGQPAPPPTLTPAMLKAIETQAAKLWPGVPVVPTMSTGATDSIFLTANGIPSFGVSGLFADASGNGVHGLNERIRVKSLYDGRDFLYALVKDYARLP